MTRPLVLLASASPRRSELLRQVGVAHEVRPVAVDESWRHGEAPAEYVLRLAEEKARTLWAQLPAAGRLPVLAADTTVALEGEIFGKPGSRAESVAMLARLSGRTHQVHTAVALLHDGGAIARVVSSSVTMREISRAEMDWYWDTGEPADKAGGYAVQGRAAIFISHIAGSYSGVMGLPLCETWELLCAVPGLIAGGVAA
ncbi:MAG: septum formation inhibitor Maf [Gammaproteobacteria bacterium]|nr:septum formation inhibitor Maf [Gammaproteobacteria bacterium]